MGYYQRAKRDNESEAVEMIDPKTDWVASDDFSLEDYTRITSNLHEVAELVGVPTVSYPTASYALVLTASHRASIVAQYNSIVNALGGRRGCSMGHIGLMPYS